MRKVIATLLICTAILYSCKSKHENIASKYLNAGNLQEQLFTIDIHKDTNLVTQQGLKIKIDANSIEASTPTVTIQVKEALTLEAMLKAGLTTQTKDGMLSSDGMFYLATKEESKIKKPLEISVPTMAVDANMQLYKGKEENGTIVWEDPKPLEAKPLEDSTGRVLFNRNCASCHAIDRQLTASDLGWIENRWPNREHLRSFIKKPSQFVATMEADAKQLDPKEHPENRADTAKENRIFQQIYARCIYCKNKTAMTAFDGFLSDKEIDQIIDYTNKESKRLGLPRDYNPNKDCDSCVSTARESLAYAKSRTENAESVDVSSDAYETREFGTDPDTFPASARPTLPASAKHVEFNNRENYQFKLEAYGWYNVDCLLTGKFNSVETELSVEVTATGLDMQSIFLVIPDVKVFVQGGKLENGKDYGFNTMDGKLTLPQGYQAYILLVGEQNGKTYFGKTVFKTSLKGHIKIGAKETAKEQIIKEVANFKLGVPPPKKVDSAQARSMTDTLKKTTREEERKLEEKLRKCVCMPNNLASEIDQ
jgi:hypothetical protein